MRLHSTWPTVYRLMQLYFYMLFMSSINLKYTLGLNSISSSPPNAKIQVHGLFVICSLIQLYLDRIPLNYFASYRSTAWGHEDRMKIGPNYRQLVKLNLDWSILYRFLVTTFTDADTGGIRPRNVKIRPRVPLSEFLYPLLYVYILICLNSWPGLLQLQAIIRLDILWFYTLVLYLGSFPKTIYAKFCISYEN